ncbi:MAG: porin family protein [Bacteroidetes bacterium]|nr:porin family protein [Bacteroidota bacterium]
MNKILLMAAVLSASVFNAQKFEAGIKIGYVNSTLDFTVDGQKQPVDAKNSVYITVPLEYHAHKNLSVFAELGMAGLGGENLMMENGERSRLHLTTVYFPVGLKIYPVERFALVGAYNFGFVTNALGKENGKDVDFEDLHNGNSSFSFGTEYKFKKGFAAEVKYNIGTSNIAKTIPGAVMKNNFLQIGLGYYFDNERF